MHEQVATIYQNPAFEVPISKGGLFFCPHFFTTEEASAYFQELLDATAWEQRSIKLFGKEHPQPRLTAWYADAGVHYTYSGLEWAPSPWTSLLQGMRSRVEAAAGHAFNSVLVNLYRDGSDSMGWHSDDEPELGPNPTIASVSLGEARSFHLKPKQPEHGERKRLVLGHGSLLIMGGRLQHHWKHQIPKSKRPLAARINLTFRFIHSNNLN